jgi:hypothetical protein
MPIAITAWLRGGAECCELRLLSWSAQDLSVKRPPFVCECGEPFKNLRNLSRGSRRSFQDRSGARANLDGPGSSGCNVYPLDVLGTDSDDAGLHDLSQRPGFSGEVNPASAAARIRWDGYADESHLPHRPLGNHPKLSDAGLYRVCAEISGGLVGTSSTALG